MPSSVWDDPKHTRTFQATVTVLYLTRAEIERQVKAGHVSKADYERYWKKVKAKHLEEVAVQLSPSEYARLVQWVKTWGHRGGSYYLPKKKGYAVRAGGANQHEDPLNVFFLTDG